MIRVLIVDGQAQVRWGLRMRLALEPDMSIVGETGKRVEALAMAQVLGPDAIVVDVGMRSEEDVKFVQLLKAAAPSACVVVLTLHGDADARVRAREAGALAFLEKRGGAVELTQAIRQCAERSLLENGQSASVSAAS